MAEATVVLDTNVWISGVLWAGIPARIVASIESELLTSAVTQELITELLEVLSRPKFERRLAALRSSPGEVVDAVVSVCQIVSRAPLAQPVLRDVDDDEVLACAQACGAHWIITGDGDLLSLASWGTARIATPREFWSAFRGGRGAASPR